MKNIVCIESATSLCSVALLTGDHIVAYRESPRMNDHAANLTLLVEELLESCHTGFDQIDAFAVSKGPGSYTGLRIGTSVAKGYCYALGKPLISVNTLEIMAWGVADTYPDALLCPMIDARRMEVYTALYSGSMELLEDTRAVILDEFTFADRLRDSSMVFFGDGAGKMSSFLANTSRSVILDDFKLSAGFMKNPVLKRFQDGIFEDVAYFEPFYLKEFIAAAPRVKGLQA